nr:hypothetical protein Iba_chr12cCG20730 [Ipomoea batatas]
MFYGTGQYTFHDYLFAAWRVYREQSMQFRAIMFSFPAVYSTSCHRLTTAFSTERMHFKINDFDAEDGDKRF